MFRFCGNRMQVPCTHAALQEFIKRLSIPHKWILLFAHTDWLAWRWLAKYYSPPNSQRKTKWLPVWNKVTLRQLKLLFGPLVIQLEWYILKQLFTSVSVNIYHYSPPLRWIIDIRIYCQGFKKQSFLLFEDKCSTIVKSALCTSHLQPRPPNPRGWWGFYGAIVGEIRWLYK